MTPAQVNQLPQGALLHLTRWRWAVVIKSAEARWITLISIRVHGWMPAVDDEWGIEFNNSWATPIANPLFYDAIRIA